METEYYQRFVKNLRRIIDKSGLKHKVVAERAGLTPYQLSSILNSRKRVDITIFMSLCAALNVTPNSLCERDIEH